MATLKFHCPHCARFLQVPDDLAAKIVRCPGCNKTFVAPPAAVDSPPTPPPPDEEVLSLPLADDEPADDWFPNQPLPSSEEEESEVVEVVPAGSEPQGTTPRRKKKRKKRKRQEQDGFLDALRYYTGGFGVFPAVLLGLVGMSLLCGVVSCLLPSVAVVMIAGGSGMYLVGWVWFLVIAFRDDSFHGVLCMVTQLYCFVYLFVNLEETWKPAALMVLGGLVSGVGVGLFLTGVAPDDSVTMLF